MGLDLPMDICPGTTLGRYELLVPIATGGMAQVWAARQHGSRGFSKTVAVKLLLTELVDDVNFQQMFLDEAELASRIKHPNVTQILDLGEQEGVLYQVMEYVDGEPLHAVLREQKAEHGLPLDLAVRIVSQACAGLHAAHELRDPDGNLLNLVHRDVTPQNLLVTYEGQLKILDFGVAKAASNLQQTSVGQMKGKVPYMAPEQARGEPVDRRTDIFALGVVLYQLATGRHPFRGDNDLITLRAITASTPAPPPEDMIEGFPEELNEVIVRALAKERNDRFPTMEQMGESLDRAALRLPIGTEDLGAFMRRTLGKRGDARRAAIRDATQSVGADGATGTPIPGQYQPGRVGPAPTPPMGIAAVPPREAPPARPAQPFQPAPSAPEAVPAAMWPAPLSGGEAGDRETPLPDSAPTLIDPNILQRASAMDRGPRPPPSDGGPFAMPPAAAVAPGTFPAPQFPRAPAAAIPTASAATPTPNALAEPVLQIAPAVVRAPKSIPPPSKLDRDLEQLAAMGNTSGGSKSMIAGLIALVILIGIIVAAISMAPDSDAPKIPDLPTPAGS